MKVKVGTKFLKMTDEELNAILEFKDGKTCWYNIGKVSFNKPAVLRFVATRRT